VHILVNVAAGESGSQMQRLPIIEEKAGMMISRLPHLLDTRVAEWPEESTDSATSDMTSGWSLAIWSRS